MCGIVGYVGERPASEIILDGLTRLEYRGYDSAGIALFHQGDFQVRRAEGKLGRLKELLKKEPLSGKVGIGHTRWATHGRPSENNAHPHRAGDVVLVHNGIIENYLSLKKELIAQGCEFRSDTDTETLVHLFNREIQKSGSCLQAFRNMLQKIQGSYAIVALCKKDPASLFVARHQSPLVLGRGKGENFLASDIPALLPYTREVLFLEDGDYGLISRDKTEIYDRSHQPVERAAKQILWDVSQAEKGGYRHFMLKEIFENSRAFMDTLRGRVFEEKGEVLLDGAERIFSQNHFERIYLVACGTSYHAALLGKFYIEEFARIPVHVDVASEFRYRNPVFDSKTLLWVISQSGETADTLMAVKNAKAQGARVYAICNGVDSSIARESDAVLYTHAGPEIGVAATKTFITQIEALFLTALYLGKSRDLISASRSREIIEALLQLPLKIDHVLKQHSQIKQWVDKFSRANYFLFIGRGFQYPIALEGALKLKEISYLNSEGHPAGELKHGPIAMIDRGTPVIALMPRDDYYEKVASNVQEVLAREASVLCITTEGEEEFGACAQSSLFIPRTLPSLYPLLTAIPLQLFAYEMADAKGYDVDQPRNLAKSVTVE